MSESLAYLAARALIVLLQALPLSWVARLGRLGGGLAYWLDARHRRVARRNLARCFGAEKSEAELRALAREHFRRLGENYLCAVKTATLRPPELRGVLEVSGAEKVLRAGRDSGAAPVLAIGHFGNFELYAHATESVPDYQFATTYRALSQPRLNQLLQDLRARSGCRFFERRTEASALRAAMHDPRLMVGFLADQHAGDHGLGLPFLGELCSTSAAPALFALRFGRPLQTAICYRVALGRWRIEVGDPIPTFDQGQPRSVEAISLELNRAFETAVRRDPANWFWVHNRWKPGKYRLPRSGSSVPAGSEVEESPTSAGSEAAGSGSP